MCEEPNCRWEDKVKIELKCTAFEVDARSKAWVCGRSLAGIAGSNPTGGIKACIL